MLKKKDLAKICGLLIALLFLFSPGDRALAIDSASVSFTIVFKVSESAELEENRLSNFLESSSDSADEAKTHELTLSENRVNNSEKISQDEKVLNDRKKPGGRGGEYQKRETNKNDIVKVAFDPSI